MADPKLPKGIQGINFQELPYAGDTLILAKIEGLRMNACISLTLSQNISKCCYFAHHRQSKGPFCNPESKKCIDEETYLEAQRHGREFYSPKHEVRKRISATIRWQSSRHFNPPQKKWNWDNCPTPFNFKVLDRFSTTYTYNFFIRPHNSNEHVYS